jgi:hypothetical protein
VTVLAPTENPEVTAYVAEVAQHLADLPAAERDDLLDDLAQHLAEIAAEPGPPLVERLGSPAEYAAELLASAGVTPRPTRRPPGVRAVAVADAVRSSAAYRAVAAFAPELRPAWWVARGALAAWLLAEALTHEQWHTAPLFLPKPGGSAVLGLVLLVVSVVASVSIGRRALSRWQWAAVMAADVVLLAFGAHIADKAFDRLNDVQTSYVVNNVDMAPNDACLRSHDGRPIQNLYAYDGNGNPIDQVVLYDEKGTPIDNLCVTDVDDNGRPTSTQYATDANGRHVVNVFPRRRYVTVTDPTATGAPPSESTVVEPPPAIVPPKLAAPGAAPTTASSTTAPTTATTVGPPPTP